MRTFLTRRIVFSVVALIGATFIVFALSRALGDPRYLYLAQGRFSQEQWDALGREMHLDKPLVYQYAIWLGRAVRGDWGTSVYNGRKVTELIGQRIVNTLQLGMTAFIFAGVVGVPLGILSAIKRGSMWDLFARGFALLGQAAPPFWLGIILILIFAANLQWLPSATKGEGFAVSNFVLPTVTISWLFVSANIRLVRTSMLEILDSEFIKLARAKGVSQNSIIWKHAFQNALIAPLTFAGINVAALITGSVLTETVFAWPGLGRLAINAVYNNDFPVLTGCVLIFTFIYVVVNFIIDILYALIDPRIRLS